MGAWDECGDDVTDDQLRGKACYGGLDLSATTDLTAFELLFPIRDRIYRRGMAWLPKEGLRARELNDRVPYSRWGQEGRLELTPGPVVDHEFVIARIVECSRQYRIERITFDRWGAETVRQRLHAEGLQTVPFGQGFASMSAPTKELQSAILTRRLAHGGCPLLRWQAGCSTVSSDPAGNIKIVKPDRLRHTKRVDSMVALVMAMDGVMRREGSSLDAMLREPIIAA